MFPTVLKSLITFVLIAIAFVTIGISIKKQQRAIPESRNNQYTLEYPSFFKWVGFIELAVCLVLLIAIISEGLIGKWTAGHAIGAVIVGVLACLGLSIIIAAYSQSIVFDQNQLVRHYWLRKERIVYFDKIDHVTEEVAASGTCRLSFFEKGSKKPILRITSDFVGFKKLEDLMFDKKLLSKRVGVVG